MRTTSSVTRTVAGDNYNHSSIARVAITDITGDAVSTSEDNKTVSKNYTATIPSSCDKNNLRVLVYVLRQYGSQTIIRTADYGDYYVDNAISCGGRNDTRILYSRTARSMAATKTQRTEER